MVLNGVNRILQDLLSEPHVLRKRARRGQRVADGTRLVPPPSWERWRDGWRGRT